MNDTVTAKKILSGWLVLDKPAGVTSAQIVGKFKYKLRQVTGVKPKIGHTGTLDPFATGILPLALGEATKLSQLFLDASKSYEFTLKWGIQTATADLEGDVIAQSDICPEQSILEKTLSHFIGAHQQLPPKYSALKVNGERAYDLARQNINFELSKRTIYIDNLSLLAHDCVHRESKFSVSCSKGTYVRTLGEDIAKACGSVGHLSALRRTKVGFFSLQNAILPDINEKDLYSSILKVTKPLNGILAVYLDDFQEKAIRFGQKILWNKSVPEANIFPILRHSADQQIIALGCYDGQYIVPKRILNV